MSTKITRSLSSYTEEHRQFLEDKVEGRSYTAITVLFNKKFGTNITHKTIRNLCRRFGLSNGKPDRRPYSNEQINYLRENVLGVGYAELSEMFNKQFDLDTTATQIGELCRYNGFSNGLDSRFQDKHSVNLGRTPKHALPDGTETITADGYVMLKHNGVLNYKHIIVWEQAHGQSVPQGHHIVFGDGDRRNFSIDNLFCITATQNAIRTRNKLHGATPELAAAGIALAKLYSQIGERKKEQEKKRQRLQQRDGNS